MLPSPNVIVFDLAYLVVFAFLTYYFRALSPLRPKKNLLDSLIMANGFTAVLLYVIVDLALSPLIGFAAYPDMSTVISIILAFVDGKLVTRGVQKVNTKKGKSSRSE